MASNQNLALQALDRIALHEKECGERWGEALAELKALRAATDAHAHRWEKLAWLVVASVMTGLIAMLLSQFLQ